MSGCGHTVFILKGGPWNTDVFCKCCGKCLSKVKAKETNK
jgi:hypothetical protein